MQRADAELSAERVVKVDRPSRHYAMLAAPNGRFLGVDDEGQWIETPAADDRVMWLAEDATQLRHAVTGRLLAAEAASERAVRLSWQGRSLATGTSSYAVAHGPARLPSEYLAFLRENGWVCLASILAPETVAALERVACTDRYADRYRDRSQPMLNQDPAMARTAAEPVSLWLIRQYMRTEDICLAHPPALIVLGQDDGKRNVQGWHSDFPYHWGIPVDGTVPTPTGETVLGVQRNVCVSDFAKERGATAFKLGSHALEQPPPDAWGTAAMHARPGYRAAHGLPYNGPDADVVEAPGGSTILYDSRTWHRAGVNRTPHRRAAMLQAMIPTYVMPKNDTSVAYKSFVGSAAHAMLNERERDQFRRLMVHPFPGSRGRYAMTLDAELSAS